MLNLRITKSTSKALLCIFMAITTLALLKLLDKYMTSIANDTPFCTRPNLGIYELMPISPNATLSCHSLFYQIIEAIEKHPQGHMPNFVLSTHHAAMQLFHQHVSEKNAAIYTNQRLHHSTDTLFDIFYSTLFPAICKQYHIHSNLHRNEGWIIRLVTYLRHTKLHHNAITETSLLVAASCYDSHTEKFKSLIHASQRFTRQ